MISSRHPAHPFVTGAYFAPTREAGVKIINMDIGGLKQRLLP